MRTVVFLQNAWSPHYAGKVWPRQSWLWALRESRSGQRLRLLIDDFDVCENTTPEVGPFPSSICKPDYDHIEDTLNQRLPIDVVFACGEQAGLALDVAWKGHLIVVPHPAFRLLSNELYIVARKFSETLPKYPYKRVQFKQGKGKIEQRELTA